MFSTKSHDTHLSLVKSSRDDLKSDEMNRLILPELLPHPYRIMSSSTQTRTKASKGPKTSRMYV